MSATSLAMDTPELARHYEQISAQWQFRAGCELIDALSIQQGERVLDIGTGTGLVAEYAADQTGASGVVIGIDPLPLRIDIATGRARSNLHFKVGNAYDLGEFAPEHFDVVYLNAVFHWLQDKEEPLRQIQRVLKRGGRLGITTGSKEHQDGFQAVLRNLFMREPYNRYLLTTANTLHRVSAAELEKLLLNAGFSVQRLEVRPNDNLHASPEAAIRFSQASSFGNFLRHLPPELQAQAEAEIIAELERTREPGGVRQGGARIFTVAVRN